MSLGYAIDALATSLGGGPWATAAAVGVVVAGPILGLVMVVAALGQIIERKVAAAMQRRVGPNSVGLDGVLRLGVRLGLCWLPRSAQDRTLARIQGLPVVRPVLELARRLGLGQLAADGVKMLGKEDLVPAGTDGRIFRLAPYLALLGALLPFAVIPWGNHLVMIESGAAAVYVMATGGLAVVALLMAGWGSGNKFSLLGGMRAVAQVVSYEIPVGLAIAGVVLWCGTLDLHRIVASQYHEGWLSFLGWNIVQSPFLAVLAGIAFFAGLAECQRAPFDMAEAESELVSGFNTEYSGMRWGMFAMAEYSEMVLVGCLWATLFLGGYQSPIGESWIVALPVWAEVPIHAGILLAKFTLAVVVMVWIRWTLPRFRVDQVMRLCWLKLVPLALVCLVGLVATMLFIGATETGPAYGRLEGTLRLAIDWKSWGAAWTLPLLIGGVLVLWARRRHGQVHPALRRLAGEP
jgi:NADH-quinone oxidoreductase subunit H